MAKLRQPGIADNADAVLQSELWRSLESVEILLNKALPGLKCPICGENSFTLHKEFSVRKAPQIVTYRWGNGLAEEFTPTLTISCDECGNFLFFAEEELLKRSENIT